ncbi:MAG: hypothetical protein PVS2B2_06420 [Candidatus Acidiferrum sp.]
MNIRPNCILYAVFLISFVVSGCNKSADQQGPDAASNNANGPNAPGASNNGSSRDSGMHMPFTTRPLVVPAQTSITVVLDETIGSKVSNTGQTFAATVHAPVDIDGKVAIPKGARATGIVKDAKSAGRFKGGAVLSLTLTSVTVNGSDYEIQTSSPTMASKGKGKRTAVMVGGGAGGGALIGGLAGGGKGALIGGLIGAGAGTAGAGLTGNREITLPAETALTFKLLQSVEIKQK